MKCLNELVHKLEPEHFGLTLSILQRSWSRGSQEMPRFGHLVARMFESGKRRAEKALSCIGCKKHPIRIPLLLMEVNKSSGIICCPSAPRGLQFGTVRERQEKLMGCDGNRGEGAGNYLEDVNTAATSSLSEKMSVGH